MGAKDLPGTRLYIRPKHCKLMALLFAPVAVPLLLGAVAADRATVRVELLVIDALLVALAYRIWRGGVLARRAGVTVFLTLSTRRWSWDAIERFAVMPAGRYPYVCHLIPRDGQHIPITALSTPRGPKRKLGQFQRQIEEPTAELNTLLARYRPQTPLTAETLQ